jgi:hypothetical protein
MRKHLVHAKYIYRKSQEALKKHVVDSTAILVLSNPLYSTLETVVSGMSNSNSINARTFGTGLTYAGMGRLFTKGLDLSRKKFNIVSESSEKVKHLHDAFYSAAFNIAISPPIYLAAGVRDAKEIALGTVSAAGMAFFAGGSFGYAVDAYRDLMGIQDSVRIPELVRRQNGKLKIGLAAALVASSIGAMGLIYHINSSFVNPEVNASNISAQK